ncbi:MAG: beta-galactosidase, partial [Bacteroidales bacterium]|nr:beta-galactosidase [Bacteroidales bacterium]
MRILIMLLLASILGRTPFNEGWTFTKDGESRVLDLPHDWAVEGEFAQEYPGETGKLPWWGQAVYSKTLEVSKADLEGVVRLEVDGAMSGATLLVNGQEVVSRPYGYISWAAEITPYLHEGPNKVEIALNTLPESSRWYPGGGIYRNVWLVRSPAVGVAHWGTYVTTDGDIVNVEVTLRMKQPCNGKVTTRIKGFPYEATVEGALYDGRIVKMRIETKGLKRWSPSSPEVYIAETTVEAQGLVDVYETPFGVRTAEWRADGFYLNGEKTFLKGVCLHHDAGALGAMWNEDAWVRRLLKLKEMGCNAIRCTHNPPAPEFLDLCDSMGFLVLDEFTDTWTWSKKENGYAKLFDEWAERDLVDMIHRDRNHPCIIAWSIGNECGEQGDPTRWWVPQMLTDICHREDPTRPTTAGNDNPWAAGQDYAGTIDIYGFNYKPHLYAQFRDTHPGKPFYGSETASCISTRGYYRFPVSEDKSEGWNFGAPFQVSSYDLYAPAWASCPDYEWGFEDQVPECAGEFVWTGYDYLGEPTPYNLDIT